jgi:adenosylcobinamide-GDP ribazoletransferase
MKDPHIGSFGTVGLIVLLLLKITALAAVLQLKHPALPLLAAPLLGRWMAVLMLASQPLAKPDGMAAQSRRGLGPVQVFLASLLPLVLLIVAGGTGVGGRAVLGYVAVSLLVMLSLGRWARARIGGITGDVCGATIEVTETAVLIVACVAACTCQAG